MGNRSVQVTLQRDAVLGQTWTLIFYYAPLQGEEANAKGENDSIENVNPFAKAGFLSTMTFWWLNPLLKHGKEKILEDVDILQLRQADQAQTCYLMFTEQLSKLRQKAKYESPSMFTAIFSC